MATFDTAALYIDSVTDMEAKVAAIDLIIASLLTLAASSASKDDVKEYMLDDGQTKIRTEFRGMSSIMDAITNFEKLRQMYLNRLNGRIYRLVDSKSIICDRGTNRT